MDVREKLVELLEDCKSKGFWLYGKDCKTGEVGGHEMSAEDIANYLIENCVTVQEWISVEDRLPEPWKDVLAFYENKTISIDAMSDGGKWYSDYVSTNKVTHWMPLPNYRKENDYG